VIPLLVTISVLALQRLLNRYAAAHHIGPLLKTDGLWGPKTQSRYVAIARAVNRSATIARVDGRTARAADGTLKAIDRAAPVARVVVAPSAAPHPADSAPPQDVSPQSTPAGYDLEGARRLSRSVANNLRRGKASYDRRLLESFQRKAGLTPDRAYGGRTRGALVYFGQRDAPQPFSAPHETIPYAPPH
jgi:hypothetical protein